MFALAAWLGLGLVRSKGVRADTAARKCLYSGPESIRPIESGGGCIGYTADRAGRSERVEFGRALSGHMMASPDGRTVVMVQSYLYGRYEREKHEVTEFDGESNPEVVFIYRDHKLAARHRTHDLVMRGRFYSNSESHVSWTRDLGMPRADDGRFVLDTVDFRRLVFDGTTGKILRTEDRSDVERSHVMARGRSFFSSPSCERFLSSTTRNVLSFSR